MVNAGRILIMPRGEWDALTSYNMLDLVTKNGVAYLAKQANVGQDPALDTTMTYWQTFGSAVVPDNDTIIYDGDGDLAVNLDGTTLKYDAVNSYIKVAIDGVTLKYDSANGYIYADVSTSLAGLDDVQLTSIQNGQIIAYNSTSQKFVNIDLPVGGGSKIKVTTAEATLYGQTVTLSDGVTTLSGTFSNSGEYTFEGVELTGNLTISSSDGNDRATRTLYVQYYSSYAVSLAFFEATVTVTFPYTEGASCTLSDGVTTLTATTSPMAFSVPNTGTWTASVTLDGASKTDTVTITTDGQTEALTIAYGTINVTYDNDFRGVSITCVNGGTTITKTAPAGGNTMSFYPPTTGNWTISGTVGGTPYSTTANVTSLSTPVSVNLETIPNGSTATPTDDIQKWLACAGIKDKSYTTLNEVLADSETYNALLGDSNACAYMKRSTTWSTDICADQYAMNLLGQYDTACDALLSDVTWTTALSNSPYWYGHTDSGVLIHGANGESAYILDGGSPVTITVPSTLDAGTYTVYSTVAKDPTDLSADYSKTIRICPNTKEIVVRPDNALYWWGYNNGEIEIASTANGWTFSGTAVPATFQTNYINVKANAGSTQSGAGTRNTITGKTTASLIYTGGTGGYGRYLMGASKECGVYPSGVVYNDLATVGTTLTKVDLNIENKTGYVYVNCHNNTEVNIWALLAE